MRDAFYYHLFIRPHLSYIGVEIPILYVYVICYFFKSLYTVRLISM